LFVTFLDGMEELPHALAARLPPEAVRFKARVTGVTRDGAGWRLGLADGFATTADAVIIATESYQAGRMLRYTDPSLAHLLDGIPYASSATVTLGWRRADIPHPLDGFGFVVPQVERRPIIACTFSSVKYPGRAPEGFALLRVFVGGALNEAILAGDDDTLTRVARAELGELLGVQAPPLFSRVSRYPKAMPQYHVGHLARVDAVDGCLKAHPGLALAGGAYRGVGIADCVRSGEEAAERLIESG
jgi:oxygen-dependent protoporphyrinogen oxidase